MTRTDDEVFRDVLKRRFDHVWERLARQGFCDARGSCEYERIWDEFNREFHAIISNFIFDGANDPI
jgi:hypothetical protein